MSENVVAGKAKKKPGRARKSGKNFACQMDAAVFDRLEDYCGMACQSKTVVVELALKEYLDGHYDQMAALMGRTPGPGAGSGREAAGED